MSTVNWLLVEEPISAGLLEMARSAPTAGERVLAMLLCVAVFALKIYGILSPLIACHRASRELQARWAWRLP